MTGLSQIEQKVREVERQNDIIFNAQQRIKEAREEIEEALHVGTKAAEEYARLVNGLED